MWTQSKRSTSISWAVDPWKTQTQREVEEGPKPRAASTFRGEEGQDRPWTLALVWHWWRPPGPQAGRKDRPRWAPKPPGFVWEAPPAAWKTVLGQLGSRSRNPYVGPWGSPAEAHVKPRRTKLGSVARA